MLRLDSECEEAREGKLRVMARQLVNMGISLQQSIAAVRNYGSVKMAIDSLLASRGISFICNRQQLGDVRQMPE